MTLRKRLCWEGYKGSWFYTIHSLPLLMANRDQCAVGPNGKLLSPSKINFFNDPDDIIPVSGPNAPKNAFELLRAGGRCPASHVGGARRSSRASKPSGRLLDPDNAESIVTGRKRKASSVASSSRHCASRRIADSDDEPTSDIQPSAPIPSKASVRKQAPPLESESMPAIEVEDDSDRMNDQSDSSDEEGLTYEEVKNFAKLDEVLFPFSISIQSSTFF